MGRGDKWAVVLEPLGGAGTFLGSDEEGMEVPPCTPHPQPSTLNPQPSFSTLNPQPSTLNPQPSTLNTQPSTLRSSKGTVEGRGGTALLISEYLAHKTRLLPRTL